MSWRTIAARDFKAWVKDRRRVTVTIVTPIVMMIVMYGAFHDVKPTSVNVAILRHDSGAGDPIVDQLRCDHRIHLIHVKSVREGRDLVRRGSASVFLYLPSGFPDRKATVYYDPTDPMGSRYVLNKIQRSWARHVAGTVKSSVRRLAPVLKAAPERPVHVPQFNPFRVQTPVKGMKYFDYLVPGLAVMTAAMGSIFGLGRLMMEEIELGVAYALFAAPIRARDVVIGRFVNMTIWGCVRCAIVVLVALALGAKILHPVLLFLVGALSAATMVGLGLLMASLAGRSEVAEMATGAVTIPMMFLSGIFMPISVMPGWARAFALINPMYYMGDAARKAALLGYLDPVDLLILLGFTLGFLAAGSVLYDRVREYL